MSSSVRPATEDNKIILEFKEVPPSKKVEDVSTPDQMVQEVGIMTSILQVMQRMLGNIGGQAFNDLTQQIRNFVVSATRYLGPASYHSDQSDLDKDLHTNDLIREILERMRQRNNERRCNKTSTTTTTTTKRPVTMKPMEPEAANASMYQSPVDFIDYGNSMLKIFSDYTTQIRNMNDRTKDVADQISQMFHTGARIMTGQLKDGSNSWSYGEPAFRGVSAGIEMMENLQKQLTQLNQQWRDLGLKVLPFVGGGLIGHSRAKRQGPFPFEIFLSSMRGAVGEISKLVTSIGNITRIGPSNGRIVDSSDRKFGTTTEEFIYEEVVATAKPKTRTTTTLAPEHEEKEESVIEKPVNEETKGSATGVEAVIIPIAMGLNELFSALQRINIESIG